MICSASIAPSGGNTMPTLPIAPLAGAIRLRATPIAPWGQYGSAPANGGMAAARRNANDYFLLWRSHSMALMRNVLLSSSL